MDKHWGRWEQFCLDNNVDPYLQTWDDPVPIIQVFGERYRNGLAPKQNSVKPRTVEDALRAVPGARPTGGALTHAKTTTVKSTSASKGK
jgi:hypothetical protein